MGEPRNPHFYDFGTFERVPEPHNQLFLSLETPGYLNKIKKFGGTFLQILLLQISKLSKFRSVKTFEKAGAENPDDPSKKILKTLDMVDQYLSKDMKWQFGNMV